jgi:hypothetical protein
VVTGPRKGGRAKLERAAVNETRSEWKRPRESQRKRDPNEHRHRRAEPKHHLKALRAPAQVAGVGRIVGGPLVSLDVFVRCIRTRRSNNIFVSTDILPVLMPICEDRMRKRRAVHSGHRG